MKAGCCAGCQPAVSLDEAGWQPTLQQSASPRPQSHTADSDDANILMSSAIVTVIRCAHEWHPTHQRVSLLCS